MHGNNGNFILYILFYIRRHEVDASRTSIARGGQRTSESRLKK